MSVQRHRRVRIVAAATAAMLVIALATVAVGPAGSVEPPHAQSAGNLVDATIGGQPIDQVLALAFARAENPGTVTDQNPLDVTALDTVELSLTGALQLPGLLGIHLGAANQVALAQSDGQSYGASGAVLDSGGVSIGGSESPPADATIDLTAAGLLDNVPVPVPGLSGTAAAVGEVGVQVGAVASIARTPQFGPPLADSWLDTCTQDDPTCYEIASLDLTVDSPLVGAILGGVSSDLQTALGALATAAGNVGLPAACSFGTGLGTPTLANGAVEVDAATGSLTIHVGALLGTLLGDKLDDLPPNTDLLAVVTDYLSSHDGLAAGLQGIVSGLTDPLTTNFTACLTAMQSSGLIGQVAGLLLQLTNVLDAGRTQVLGTIDDIVSALDASSSPVAPIATILGEVVHIGANVQPQVATGDFVSALDTLPKQGMSAPPVPYDHTVRAIELQLLGDDGVTVALANSAAGPSSPAVAPPTTPPGETPTTTPATPTSPPAGAPTPTTPPALAFTGSSTAPLTLIAVVACIAGALMLYAARSRTRRTH